MGVTPVGCQSAFALTTVLFLLLTTADTVNASWISSVSLQKAADPRQQIAYNVKGAKHDVIRAFDPINYASDFSDEMKRHTFDSIEHSSDLGEFKRKFDSIEHNSDLNDFRKRGPFDSIGHSSDMDELSKRQEIALNKPHHHTTATAGFLGLHQQMHRSPKLLPGAKRRFDSISHSSDMDDFKRSTGDVELADEDEQEDSDKLYKPVAGDKRKFDSIDHVSDLESFKRSL